MIMISKRKCRQPKPARRKIVSTLTAVTVLRHRFDRTRVVSLTMSVILSTGRGGPGAESAHEQRSASLR